MNYDEDGWRIAVDVARLAPLTGSCSLRSRTVLGVNAELDRLRAEVEALRASRGELLALLEGWAYHGWNREREERSRALVDVASAKAEGGSNG